MTKQSQLSVDELVARGMEVVRRLLDEHQVKIDAAVLPLCERYGFGAVMQTASRLWQQRDAVGALKVCDCPALPRPSEGVGDESNCGCPSCPGKERAASDCPYRCAC